jgi:putative transposase
MPVKFRHTDEYALYFCTFTCFDWLPLFDITNSYDLVYKWFNAMRAKRWETAAYVIMPNHLHTIHYFPEPGFSLNSIMREEKQLIAYEMIHRLQLNGENKLLNQLSMAITPTERQKGQQHRVFENSFDAKAIYSPRFLSQKIDYIHYNPVRGKWKLADDHTRYEHSSASFYELDIIKHFVPFDYRIL